MSNILCIETATSICSVSLAHEGYCVGMKETDKENSHSSLLTVLIEELMREHNLEVKDLDAIAVSQGPGSYTGLRIGMSVAKGMCYALAKPLIAISTLQSIAEGMRQLVKDSTPSILLCPMVDARRMEVYTAVYNTDLSLIMAEQAAVIDAVSFSELLHNNTVYFAGDGAPKTQSIISHPNARWTSVSASARWMTSLAYQKFVVNDFEDLAYFTPKYLKEFHSTKAKDKLQY